MKAASKIGWGLLGLFAITDGLGALRYSLPVVPFPAPLDNFIHHQSLLALHAFGGAIALLAGPLQMLPSFRERHWTYHRRMGWVYCCAVLLGALAALPLAWRAQTGRVASADFFLLALAWFFSTGAALRFILRGDSARHRRWMIRSYCLTAAAITLRIYLPLSVVLHFDFSVAYPAIAWLCWIPNLIFAEFYLRRAPASSGSLQGATASL